MKEYNQILDYFLENHFGTELPVLAILSALPQKESINIIEAILEYDFYNTAAYWKLSMAYLRNGDKQKAMNLLDNAFKNNYLSESINKDYKQDLFEEEEQYKGNYGSSETYEQTVELIESQVELETKNAYSKFVSLVYRFIDSKTSAQRDRYPTMQEIPMQEFGFSPSSYIVWAGGQYIESGVVNAFINAKLIGPSGNNKIQVFINNESVSRIIAPIFEFDSFMANIDRLILRNSNQSDYDHKIPFACSIFTCNREIVKLAFTFKNQEKMLEVIK